MAKRRGKGKPPRIEVVADDCPQRERRLRVVAEDKARNGLYGFRRDVYLESRPLPGRGPLVWAADLCNLGVDVNAVADLMKWAALVGLAVRQEPAGNMAAYFLRFRPDQPELFQ